jgi:hypothetical protein
VIVNENALIVVLSDGSEVSAPLSWYSRLRHGADAERTNWRLIGSGVGVHCPIWMRLSVSRGWSWASGRGRAECP